MKTRHTHLIGIDEAGRGPLAGPVAIGVVMCTTHFKKSHIKGIKDSKKLSEAQREKWFKKLKLLRKEGILDFRVSLIGAKIIDSHGIAHAIRRGIKSCLRRIDADPAQTKILLDGSLKAPDHFKNQRTIVGGDDRIALISAASITAKVTRDRKMRRLAKLYPNYNFDVHKGYGTAAHCKSLRTYGPCEIHRLTFIKDII